METVFVLTSSWVDKSNNGYNSYDIINGVYESEDEAYAEKDELERVSKNAEGFLGTELQEVIFHPAYDYDDDDD